MAESKASVREVRLRVPASTSNLGPGFDTLGLALGLYNEFLFERVEGESRFSVEGEGAEVLRQGPSRVLWALEAASAALGVPAPAIRLTQHNQIPLARGLGGSGTAALAGIVAAFLFAGRQLEPAQILSLGLKMEGHPDNITPQTVGGFVVSRAVDDEVIYLKLAPPAGLTSVVLVPDRPLDTGLARRALPEQYSRADVIYNLSNVALLVASLATGNIRHLAQAMRDRIHQPYRAPLLPGLLEIIDAALRAGSPGAALSGAGSGIFAFARAGQEQAIAAAMEAAAAKYGMAAYSLFLPVDTQGLEVLDVR
jgi:homoserine kinase